MAPTGNGFRTGTGDGITAYRHGDRTGRHRQGGANGIARHRHRAGGCRSCQKQNTKEGILRQLRVRHDTLSYSKGKERKGREGKGREGKGREGKGREGKGREGTDAAPSALPESRFSSSKIPHRHRTVKAKSRINTDFILFPGARHSPPARPVTPPMRLAPDRYASRHNPRHACHRTSAKITGTEQSERINPDIIIGDCVTSSACLYELAAIAF